MTLQIELLHPKAQHLLDILASLNLIKIKKRAEQDSVERILKFAGIMTAAEATEMQNALQDTQQIT